MPALKIARAPRKRMRSMVVSQPPKTYEERMAAKRETAEVNALYAEFEAEEKEKRRALAQRTKDRVAYRKEQQLKHALGCAQGVQVIKNPATAKRLARSKLRKQLAQMPPELLQLYAPKK